MPPTVTPKRLASAGAASVALALAALMLVGADAGASPAAEATFKPIALSRHQIIFEPRGIRPGAIRGAQARIRTRDHGNVHVHVRTDTVRHALRRHSRVRVHRIARATTGLLVVSKRHWWHHHTSPPDTTITGGPSGTTSDATPTFNFSSTESGSTFKCRYDSNPFAPCSGPGASDTPATPLANGSHTFAVEAIDAAGNVDPTAATRTLTVATSPSPDTSPPDTTITGGPSGTTSDATPTFNFSSTESGSTFKCRYDSNPFAPCSGPGASDTPATPLANGSHTFAVEAIDAAGNVDPTAATRTLTVATSPSPDTSPPDTTITGGPSGTTSDATPTFNFSSTESGSTFKCRYDSNPFAPCSGPGASDTPATPLANGSHTFAVEAIDAAGNVDTTPASSGFTVQSGGGTTQSVSCGLGGFSAFNQPGACWRPYSDSSPFNTPIGSSTQVSSNSAQVVNRLVGFGSMDNTVAGTGGTGADWMHPIYFSQPSDPLYTIHCTVSSGQCPTLNGMQLRIPSAAQPAGAGDGHMAVIDQSSGWEWDFWQVQSKPAGGGTLTVSSAGRTMITGDGLKSGATASYFGLAAGVIRGEEMQAGEIDHALFLVVKCTNGTAVWPAATSKASGRSCSSMGLSNANAPAMGQHFYLEMSDAQINALMVPSWQKTILRAMAHYGMYVGDTGGSSWGVQIESGTSYTSFGETDPWVTFAKQAGVPTYQSSYGLQYVFKWSQAVDWGSLLRTVAAPGV